MSTPDAKDKTNADFVIFGHVLVDMLHSEDLSTLDTFCSLLKQMAKVKKNT
jgi:hypothetical protein